MTIRVPFGSVHGRFQPFHKGHLEYVLASKERCDFLWIGITQFNICHLEQSASPHRESRLANPLTYFERSELVTQVLLNAGIPQNQFGILPFPIENIEWVSNFLPKNIPIYTTIYDEWNVLKVKLLREAGYEVEVLWERDVKEFVGSNIRDMIMQNDPKWHTLVPEATMLIIEKYGIRGRLAHLVKEDIKI